MEVSQVGQRRRLKLKLQEVIVTNRRLVPLRMIAQVSEMYLRAWYNEGRWDFNNNGEAFVLSRVNEWAEGREVIIWDVGAHYGEWSEAAHKLVPSAIIHCFEIIPGIASRLTNTDWRSAHAFGLSDADGAVDVLWNQGNDTESSINPRSEHQSFQGVPTAVVTGTVRAGDHLVDELGAPDILKVDVEGHEPHVLRGFKETLQGSRAPQLIQFEYGATYVPSGSTLRAIYGLLPNYSIGRLYPGYVDFKQYTYADEHLRMGNMIATRNDALRRMLGG